MIKTFNRTPAGVKDVNPEYQFFNHNNWKGANTNKNFLSIDQESFEDCKNVYVDADGILKSRPSIKTDNEKQNLLGNYKVHNVWSFADTIVYFVKEGDNPYKLLFQKDGQSYIPDVSFDNKNDFKLVLADNKIFVFTKTDLYYFNNSNEDSVTDKWFEANDYIYIPITEYYVNGTVDDTRNKDYVNELTNSYITMHIFDTLELASFDGFDGTNIKITIGNNIYELSFVKNNELVFVNEKLILTERNFSSNDVFGNDTGKIPLLSVSRNNNCILTSMYYYADASGNIISTTDIYYIVNDVIYSKLPTLQGIIGIPKISKDGIYVFAFTSTALNIINVADDLDGNRKYPTWHNILIELDWKYAKYMRFDYPGYLTGNCNVLCNGDFITDDIFSFVASTFISTEVNAELNWAGEKGKKPLSTEVILLTCYKGNFNLDFISHPVSMANVSVTGTVKYDNSCKFDDIEYISKIQFVNPVHDLEDDDYSSEWIDVGYLKIRDLRSVKENGRTYIYGIMEYTDLNNNVLSTVDCSDNLSLFAIQGESNPGRTFNNFCIYGNIDKSNYSTGDELTLTIKKAFILSFTNDMSSVYYGYDTPIINMYADDNITNVIFSTVTKQFRHEEYLDIPSISKYEKYHKRIYVLSLQKSEKKYTDNYKFDIDSIKNSQYDSVLATDVDYKFATIKNNIIELTNLQFYEDYDYNNNVVIVKFDVTSESLEFDEPSDYNSAVERVILSYSSAVTYALTNHYLYDGHKFIKLLFECIPAAFDMLAKTRVYLVAEDTLYSSNTGKIEIEVTHALENTLIVPDTVSELDELYFSKGNTLYISQYPASETFKWYFPKISTTTFETDISALHPISATEMGIFLKNAIYYNSKTELGYVYNKSKTGVGCEKGSTVVTSFDGKSMIFSSNRGLVAMSYQDFVASTEQTLTFLSDAIHTKYKRFNNGAVKLYQYDYWIICYKENSPEAFVLDIRNASMWPVEYLNGVTDIITVYNKPLLISNNTIKRFDTSDNDYADDFNKIEWYFVSQKLHLNALNYYKRVLNLIIASVNDNSNSCDTKLEVRNYRKKVDEGKVETIEYEVDMIRTFVKRVNYAKVSEFQYKLSSNLENAIQVPLGVANIAVKYLITGVAR